MAKDGKGRGTVRKTIAVVSAGLTVAAVVKELRQPADQRTWHGTVAGFVPYDLRFPPTLSRLKQSVWAPDDPHYLLPRAFGVGWTLNAGRIVREARRIIDERGDA